MINRELIRIKTVQLSYAYFQNGNRNLDNAEKELIFSLSKSYHLYNYLLELIVQLTALARKQYDIESKRAERENEPLPSGKFVNNRFAFQLQENIMLNQFYEKQKHIWDDSIEHLRKLLTAIQQSEMYTEYLEGPDSYEEDREIWRKIYRHFVQDNDDLKAILEEHSLYWNDDKEVVDTFVLKTIKRFEENSGTDFQLLPEYDDEEDLNFACKLFRATILNAEQYQKYMSEASRNWDFSRLAYMDIVIMQIAIAEMLNFPGIPVSVTINEYVELAKLYSTPKSGKYINGMLDAIARHLVKTGKMFKPLKENNK